MDRVPYFPFKKNILFLLIGLLGFCPLSFGQNPNQEWVFKDLSSRWRILTNENGSFSNQGNAFSFKVSSADSGGQLVIEGKSDFSIFINHKPYSIDQANIRWKVDSLLKIFESPFMVTVLQKKNIPIKTVLKVPVIQDLNDPVIRIKNFTLEFSIIVSVFFSFFLIFLLNNSPQQTAEYFRFARIFTIYLRDENIAYARITSSANLLVYLFVVLTSAFILTLTNVGPGISGRLEILFFNFGRNSVTIAALLVLKFFILYFFAWIFRFTDFSPVQFFNTIRLFFLASMLSGLIIFLGFVFNFPLDGIFEVLPLVWLNLFLAHIPILFFKMVGRGGNTFFHLFSYLCVSEIIPLVILVNSF